VTDPVLDAQGRPLDQVRLLGLRARGHHGVFEHERREGQDFVVDVVLHLDTREAAVGDDLSRTVHYGDLATAVAGAVRGAPVDLLETLAARIGDVCLENPRVVATDVTVHKPQAPVTERFGDVAVAIRRYRDTVLDAAPVEDVDAVLALGTNVGDRVATLVSAVAALDATPGLTVRRASPVVETEPVGGPEQPDYLNAVVLVTTALSPRALLAACQAVEAGHGRERTVRWGPRTLDVDVIDYAGLVAAAPDLELPHPRAHERAFVLQPWAAVDPDAVLMTPAGPCPVRDLLAGALDRDGVRPGPDVVLGPAAEGAP
jgi:dihydroneopterin aldolase/2-amino-4-hydroxy-6-hydroxymethyldihydropteridine diphosphokinase